MPVFRVTWRHSDSIYSTPRTSWVEADTETPHLDLSALVATKGHREERDLTATDVHLLQVLRQFTVDHEAYAKTEVIRALVAERLAPWERRSYVPNTDTRWGARETTVYAEAISPSNAWCVRCDVNTTSGPWVAYATTVDHRSITLTRNIRDHGAAHRMGDEGVAAGRYRDASVGFDTCG
jgi:hypothetical protein